MDVRHPGSAAGVIGGEFGHQKQESLAIGVCYMIHGGNQFQRSGKEGVHLRSAHRPARTELKRIGGAANSDSRSRQSLDGGGV